MGLCGVVPLSALVGGFLGWLPWHIAGGIAAGALFPFLAMHIPWAEGREPRWRRRSAPKTRSSTGGELDPGDAPSGRAGD